MTWEWRLCIGLIGAAVVSPLLAVGYVEWGRRCSGCQRRRQEMVRRAQDPGY